MGNSNFIKFNRGECPICLGQHSRCNYLPSDEDHYTPKLIFCKGTTNDSNYIFRGHAEITGFGMWALTSEAEKWKTQKLNEQYLENQKRSEQERKKLQREKIKKSLPIKVRDQEIKKLIKQLQLKDFHRKQLLARGLTPHQIAKNGYCSVEKWQKLTLPINNQLAGIGINANKLNNPDSGILCPILNADGLFVGLRINNENWQIRDSGKYTYLSSPGRGIDNKIPISANTEEFPVAVHYPEQWTDFTKIGICEGLEYKSAIAANKLSYPIIGFSGNDFTSSPTLLKQAIETIKKRALTLKNLSENLLGQQKLARLISPQSKTPANPGLKITIAILPDSGVNEQVAFSYLKSLEILPKQLQYPLQFGYWHHLKEKGRDIDEIPSDTKIKYLSPEKAQEKLKTFALPGTDKWRKYRQYSPDIRVNEKWLSEAQIKSPELNQIILIKSGLGTGKTRLLKQWLQEELKNHGAFALGYRNTLLHHFCESSEFYHIHEDDFGVMRGDCQGKFALCVDSLLKFKPEDFDDKTIILDEVKSIITHLLTSSTIPKHLRNLIIHRFKEAIRRSSRVIALDGNLSDWVVDFLSECAPDKQILRVENSFRKERELILHKGSITKKGKINSRDKSGMIAQMLTSKRPAIVADSQEFCEKLETLLLSKDYNVLRIDGTTSSEEYAQEFLANPKKYLEANPIDALILSPSAESGIDISIKDFFTDLFILAFGTLGVDSIRQMSQRIRDQVPTHLWINQSPKVKKQISPGYQTIIDEINEYAKEKTFALANKEELLEKISNALDRNQNRIETKTAEIIQEIEYYEKSHYLAAIIFAFEQAGYTIHNKLGFSNSDIKNNFQEITDNLYHSRSAQIFNAPELAEIELEQTNKINQQEKYARQKASLKKQLPGIEDKDIWSTGFIYDVKFKHPDYLSCINNEFLFRNPIIADALKDKQLRYITTNLLRDNDVSLWEFSRKYELIQGLREAGLEKIIEAEAETEFTWQHQDIKDIYTKLRRRPKLREKLGIEKVGKYSVREVNRLLKMIGMKFVSRWKREGEKRYRVYTLCQEKTHLPYKKICYELTEKKWTNWIQKEILNLTESLEKEPEKLSIEKIAKLFSLYSLKLVTDAHNNLYNNQALSVINEQHEERLRRIVGELSNTITQYGLNTTEEDEKYRCSILENPVKIFQDLADFLDFDYQIFLDMFNSVGDSIKFQLLGLMGV